MPAPESWPVPHIVVGLIPTLSHTQPLRKHIARGQVEEERGPLGVGGIVNVIVECTVPTDGVVPANHLLVEIYKNVEYRKGAPRQMGVGIGAAAIGK